MNDLPDRPASPDIINDLNNILSIEQIKKYYYKRHMMF
jgi:hypothetical protein